MKPEETTTNCTASRSTAGLDVAAETRLLLARRRTLIDARASANFEIAEIDRRLAGETPEFVRKWDEKKGAYVYVTANVM